MSHGSFIHIVLTGRLAVDVKTEVVLALLTVGIVTGISIARLDSPWLYVLPALAVGYSAVRIALVAKRTRERVRDLWPNYDVGFARPERIRRHDRYGRHARHHWNSAYPRNEEPSW